jgi:phosphate transport system protein
MPAPTFDRELQRLHDELLAMSDMAERALVASVEALKRRDLAGAQELIALERQLGKKRFAVEMDCLTLVATQPSGNGDLRTITAILEVAGELERIAAYAGDNARIPFMVVEPPLLGLLADLHQIALKAQAMLHQAMQALMQRDLALASRLAGLAQAIPGEDLQMTALYDQVYRDLLTFTQASSRKNSPRAVVNQARYLSRVARNLKAAADQVTHIAEWVVVAITVERPVPDSVQLIA